MNQKGLAPILIVVLIAALAAGGYFIYKLPRTSVTPPTPQTTPAPSPTPSPSPALTDTEEISNWKTYTNTRYGYSFKYPQDLYLKTPSAVENTVTFLFEKYRGQTLIDQPEFGISASTDGKPLEELVNSIKAIAKQTGQVVSFQEIKLEGERAYRNENIIKDNPMSNITTLVNHNNISYKITLFYSEMTEKQKSLYDQILSTFRFLP